MAATGITAGSDNARVSDFWAQQFAKNAVDGSIWMNNVIIRDHLYKLMSGGESKHWLLWVLENYLRDRPRIDRSLSLCCGDGGHELLMYQTGKVGFVRGFDISEGALCQARNRFEGVGAARDSYLFEVLDANDLRLEDRFDLVLSCGALHHLTELEDILDRVHGLLQPDGHFVVMEFVGPNRFQWTARQCALINGLLAQLDPRYLRGGARETFGPPTIEEMLRIDPSEAVRSEEILPLVREGFRVDYEARFNGTLMHMLYPRLNTDLGNRGNPDFDTIIRLLLYLEDVLTAEGVLGPDFVLQICRRKDCPSKAPALPSAPSPSAALSGPIGCVDTCCPTEVTGWATDPGRPNRSLFVEVRVDGRRAGKVFCGTHRPDVRAAGYGNGLCGFIYQFPPSARPAPGSRVEVRVAGTRVRIGTAVVCAA
jgi:SAM-dependent methyltransferase